MTITYDLISTTTLGTASGSIDITSIPATFTDLRVTIYVPSYANNGSDTSMRINGITSGSYYYTAWNQNNASAPNAVRYLAGDRVWISNQTVYSNTSYSTFYTIDLMNYASTAVRRGFLITASQSRSNTAGDLARAAGILESTGTAFNQLTFACGSNFSVGTTVKIYGILKE